MFTFKVSRIVYAGQPSVKWQNYMNLIKYETAISNILLQEMNLVFWMCADATLNDY